MSRDQDLERNERPTPFKLEEARRNGQVARSADTSAWAILCMAMVASYSLSTSAREGLCRLLARGLAQAGQAPHDAEHSARLVGTALQDARQVLTPLLFSLVLTAVVAGLVQGRGLTLSAKPLAPDFTRLNPLQGLKRLLSLRLVYEAFKNSFKLLALAGCTWIALRALLPTALELAGRTPTAWGLQFQDAASTLAARLCAVLLPFVAADLVFTHWQFLRQQRMSRREVEDEHKHREGDPRVRHRQRELRLQFLRAARAVRHVPQAQVVVTNPTHVAVALRYEHGVTPAPLVVAKGAGQLAGQIRRAAVQAGVPVVHSARLARALYRDVPLDGYVPEQWYPPVARILVWLRSQQQARGAAVVPGAPPSPAGSPA